MIKNKMKTLDGNEAVANVAYSVTEASIIYPITPSSPMGEFADEWASKGRKNIWGDIPSVVEMQSEAGAAGALHGSLQTGALATSYTASQGLLLMLPNMYKIAGELTSAVIHVAARSLAYQSLAIFGDHSDVMSARGTGFAMLCAGGVQSAQDMALIAHAATLESRVPFLNFFDGFRTSHEVSKIELLSEEQMRAMIDDDLVLAHRQRALTPDKPFIRGTAANPDVYFQGREAVNSFYNKVPEIVEKQMKKFAELTGRKYDLVDYHGAKDADRVIVVMGSASQTVHETVSYLNAQGEKLGMIEIHLYRPFPTAQFLAALPKSTQAIAVLDRTKEAGSLGEPLYQDIITVLAEAQNSVKVIGGRYGLSSKEFTPAMVKAIFAELTKKQPKNHFTIGINDDVTHTSLAYDSSFITESDKVVRCMFFGLGADGTVSANKNSIKIIGEGTNNYAQGYFVYDSKKSGSRTVSHLRFGPEPIDAPYLIQSANFIGVHQFNFIYKTEVLKHAAPNSTFLLNSTYSAEDVWQHLPLEVQKIIIDRKMSLHVIDAYKVAQAAGMGERTNSIMQTCFFALSGILPKDEAIAKIKEAIKKTYSSKGEEVVNKNYAAVDQTLANLHQVKIPSAVSPDAKPIPKAISCAEAPKYVCEVLGEIMMDRGDDLPVSSIPVDGTYPVGTTKYEKRNVSLAVADWSADSCIQCGRCSLVCPHGVLRAKTCNEAQLAKAPKGFKSAPIRGKDGERYILQSYVEDCTGCGLCNQTCPAKHKTEEGAKAINIVAKDPILTTALENIKFFESLPNNDRSGINANTIPGVQFLEPLFEFSGACAGCGETPYVKLISQLFGDRMLVANATGCSSIYGGNLPTTPWTCNKDGRGPAWSNSLFEDNAEFGLGFKITEDQHRHEVVKLLQKLASQVGAELAKDLEANMSVTDEPGLAAQRSRVKTLKEKLASVNSIEAKLLLSLADNLVKRSIWILGGDGWAFDIGFGGLDHVLSTGRDVNIMVMDTEVYSNTGGQSSKATPKGAIAKFAAGGKTLPAKDLGLMMMSYGYVYVAHIALGANPMHALKAIKEAEAFAGPSLIIAYSHCISHGINMRLGLKQQEIAVQTGYWPLYRYNPDLIKEGKNPFILDSQKPSIPVKDFMYNENRFKQLQKLNPAEAEKLLQQAQHDIEWRWANYEKMAS